jgi:cysteine desulfurase/selenocysteine lyase
LERRKFLSLAALFAVKPTLQGTPLQLKDYAFNPMLKGPELWKDLRTLFPLDPRKVYLNNGTMGITPFPVLHAVEKSFRTIAEEGAYPPHTDDLKMSLAGVIGADVSEVVITKNVSEGTNHACWGIPLKAKDEVIMTRHEHVGGSLPWINRSRLEGIVIKVVDLGKTAAETLENIEKAITKKTRVIAVPHIPCTIGQILPVKDICALARSKNIISAIDGAHPLGMIRFDVHEIGCDYYYGCLHKWLLGPIGTGFLYVRKEILDQTRCTHVAAYSSNSFNMSENPPGMSDLVPSAQRFSYGTFCGPLFDGGIKALQLYKEIGPENIETRVRGLAENLQNKLLELGKRIEMVTPVEAISRGAQISFRIKNGSATATHDFQSECTKKNIVIRYVGESYLDCLRISTHYYNSEDDIDILVNELKKYIA